MNTTLTISTPRGKIPGLGKSDTIPVEGLSFHTPSKRHDKEEAQDVVLTVKDGPWTSALLQAYHEGASVTGSIDQIGESQTPLSVQFKNAHISSFHLGSDGYITFAIHGKLEFVIGGKVSEAVGAAAAAAAAEGVRHLKKRIQ